jgi:hypothetical protein
MFSHSWFVGHSLFRQLMLLAGRTTIDARKKSIPALAVGIVALFLSVLPSSATENGDFTETVTTRGHIDWSTGFIYAKGTGIPGDGLEATASARRSMVRADSNTLGNLFQAIQRVRINSQVFVSDLVEENQMIRDQLWGMVRQAQAVKREYRSDGTVETTLAMDMKGGFAQLSLPREIKPVPEIKTIPQERQGDKKTTVQGSPAAHTGLILDARGIQAVAAMSPRIVDENGKEIYGPAYASREFAVQQGMAAFQTDIDAAKNNPRVLGNPLTVKCLSAGGKMPCDFVISNADASRIQSVSGNLLLLKQCRVVIVLD